MKSYAEVPSRFCICGKQWHGKYALADLNPVIDYHATRTGCRFISEAEFAAQYGRAVIKLRRQRALAIGGTPMERDEQLTEAQEAAVTPMSEPEFDADGYPTERTLEAIEHWPHQDARACLGFCVRAWRWAEGVTAELRIEEVAFLNAEPTSQYIRFATGGWSGNESIMRALRRNRLVSALAWRLTAFGGLHIYQMPKATVGG